MDLYFILSLVSFGACITTAYLVAKTSLFSFLDQRGSRLGAIDGLRGYLALAVFVHHFSITYVYTLEDVWVSPVETFLINYGKVGVAIFFMISGFLFIERILRRKTMDWLAFFQSRVFRIYPLYMAALIIISIYSFAYAQFELNSSAIGLLTQYIHWIAFHGVNINGVHGVEWMLAGVEWTLRYEWLFYVSLPFVALLISKGRVWTIMLSLIMFAAYLFPYEYQLPNNAGKIYFSYLSLFGFGGLAAYLSRQPFCSGNSFFRSSLCSFIALAALVFSIFYPNPMDQFHILVIFLFFLPVALGNDLFGFLRIRPSLILGEISYSIYLMHGLVLFLLFRVIGFDISGMSVGQFGYLMPVVGVLVVIFSMCTFLTIEKPFMGYGKALNLNKTFKRYFLFVGRGVRADDGSRSSGE